jgi:DNA-binding FadR family transcriptional regulator
MTYVEPARPRLASKRIADRIAQQLALELLDGDYQPGQRLPSEKAMLQDLGSSRQALRGALRLLEAWGLVRVKQGREGGPVVRRPAPADLVDQLAVIIQFEGVTRRDLFHIRHVFDPVIAELAAQRATTTQVEHLESILDEMNNQTHVESFESLVTDFDRTIGEASGLALFADFLEALTLVSNSWLSTKVPIDHGREAFYASTLRPVVKSIKEQDSNAARIERLKARDALEGYWFKATPELIDFPVISFGESGITTADLTGMADPP